ncbi:type IV pilus assembly protein PilA [Paenibacillus shirakamiensis]|uniref:Type IV pilus assembly protein PilA n=1 Tax=Paenibacillus shirakamiensis TaxID=1265935 RepID=A0ABS4JIQ2_9BACL|nr:prepilin-type N-terminal cleavage/methylation domain-containing protein [Paenibacillus shirakamiensis]MBP2001577.1 type IV pilus assembly protein PilA [Paenibacillus shirakamiensis]
MLARAMNARLKKLGKEEKGFTLIELLAVIVIIGIIAIIAIPLISGILSNTKQDANVATAGQIYDAARLYVISELNGDFKNKTVPINGDDATSTLMSKGYLDKKLLLPSTKAQITGGNVKFDANGVLDSAAAVTITTSEGDIIYTSDDVLKAKRK